MLDFRQKPKPHAASGAALRAALPAGVTLRRTLRGHTNYVNRLAWSPDGAALASASHDHTVRVWDAATGICRHTLRDHTDAVDGVAWSPLGGRLASGSGDDTVRLWDAATGLIQSTLKRHGGIVFGVTWNPDGTRLASTSQNKTICLWQPGRPTAERVLEGHRDWVRAVAFSPDGARLASASDDHTLGLWDVVDGKRLAALKGHGDWVLDVAWSPDGKRLASASSDRTVKVWDAETGTQRLSLEGHTGRVTAVGWSTCGRLLASKSKDGTVRLWHGQTGAALASLSEPASGNYFASLAWHPNKARLAVVGSDPGTREDYREHLIHIYDIDVDALLGTKQAQSVPYLSARVVLVGERTAGKTTLGYLLAHGEYQKHDRTHGQQFWRVPRLCPKPTKKRECEAVLWDLAGQDDYQIIHALSLEDVDLGLLVFVPARDGEPLAKVDYWLKQLRSGRKPRPDLPLLLVSAQSDVSAPNIPEAQMREWCRQRGIADYVVTSAKDGTGLEALTQLVKNLVPWQTLVATSRTETFQRIRDFVLQLKADQPKEVLVEQEELGRRLSAPDAGGTVTGAELETVLMQLETHGFVKRLVTSRGTAHVLLAPELLNCVAASMVLEARRNAKGLGSLEEARLLAGGYDFPEARTLGPAGVAVLVDAATELFLSHAVAFRERDHLAGQSYLVFPGLINLRQPVTTDAGTPEDGAAYVVTGAVENVYASLVVLMGYTPQFVRTDQWQDTARYEFGDGSVCGFRVVAEGPGGLEFALYFSPGTPEHVRRLFTALFEGFLNTKTRDWRRYDPLTCPGGHVLDRTVQRKAVQAAKKSVFCPECGKEVNLGTPSAPATSGTPAPDAAGAALDTATARTCGEAVLFKLRSWVDDEVTAGRLKVPECFISYAWGDKTQERWVRQLAEDLEKAGVALIFDQWDSTSVGASVPRFVEQVGTADRVLVIGTTAYRRKYDNNEPMRPCVVAAEGDIIGARMLGGEPGKECVLPLLLEGDKKTSLPPLLHPRVYADFREASSYWPSLLDVLASLLGLGPRHEVAVELRRMLEGPRMM